MQNSKDYNHIRANQIAPVSSAYYRYQEKVLIRDYSPSKVHQQNTMPAGETGKPTIVDNRDGTIS